MPNVPNKKFRNTFYFSVEGETELWYLKWLEEKINACEIATHSIEISVSINPPNKAIRSIPLPKVKGIKPMVTHIFDRESNEAAHTQKFLAILNQMVLLEREYFLFYEVAYSHFAFELWLLLHKTECCGCANRAKYIEMIRSIYGLTIQDIKQKNNFDMILSKIALDDVKKAIENAKRLMSNKPDQPERVQRKGGKLYYYYDNSPALTVHEAVELIITSCGI